MKKFVTYLVKYSGELLPPYYIGSTSEDKVNSNKYFGIPRSKKWKDVFKLELKNNKHLFSIEILSYHDTRISALEEELRIQILNNVVKSSEYFNESLACPNGFFGRNISGELNPFFGKVHSDETKTKISKIKKESTSIPWMKDRTHKVESLHKMSIIKKGNKNAAGHKNNGGIGRIFSEETKNKMRLSKIGKVASEETKKKMSESHKKRYTKLNDK